MNATPAKPDALHPRASTSLIGQERAEAAILDTLRSGKMAHAWLITGPEGVGKATLAYSLARFVLASPDPFALARSSASLAIPADRPVARRIASGAHPDLHLLERTLDSKGKLRTEIVVEDARKATSFLQSTSGEGGWKVLVVDSADDLNRNAANSLLKIIEEPPGRSLVLLVANAPSRLPATIASRCRRLRLEPLPSDAIIEILTRLPGHGGRTDEIKAAANLARGSVRRALLLMESSASELVGLAHQALEAPAGEWRVPAMRLAGQIGARGNETAYEIVFDTLLDWLRERAARGGAREAARVATLWSRIEAQKREVDVYNLDKRALLLTSLKEVAELPS
jgi:DNA polymerase-3 subunit delta'